MPRFAHRRAAFTLIEMLLVVAVICLLIAILMPALRKAKEHANVAVCMTRLDGIGQAAVSYTFSNEKRFASAFQWTRHVTCWHDWHQKERVTQGLLYPYINNVDAYMCPTFLETYKYGDQPYFCDQYSGTCKGPGIVPYYAYSMNSSMSWEGWADKFWKSPKVIQNPSKMLFYSEETSWVIPGMSSCPINNGSLGVGPDSIASYHLPLGRDLNSGRANVLFLDLHIELRWPSETAVLLTQ